MKPGRRKAPEKRQQAESARSTALVEAEKPPLIPQPHGGALRAGGTPGNKGGRPREKVRASMLRMTARAARELNRMLEEHRAALERGEAGTLNVRDLTRIASVGGRFAVGTNLENAIEEGRVAGIAVVGPPPAPPAASLPAHDD